MKFGIGLAAAMVLAALPAAAQAPANWTGLNVSLGGGYGTWTAGTTISDPTAGTCLLCVNQEQGGYGGFGRIGAGYDYQFGRTVLGAFGDFDFGSITGTIQDQEPFAAGNLTEKRAFALGARAGWLMAPDILPYVDAGFTQAHFGNGVLADTFDGSSVGASTHAFSTDGWFVGAGAEMRVAPGWALRGEYRHAEYAGRSLAELGPGPALAGVTENIDFKPRTDTVEAALVYRFNAFGEAHATPAAAALPPRPEAVEVEWSGLSLNLGGGYGTWNAATTTQDRTSLNCDLCVVQRQGGSGGFGRAGIGYDYRIDRTVLGVFGDADFGNISGTIQDQGPFFAGKLAERHAFAVGARAGWLVLPDVLPYVDVGFTQAHFGSADMVVTFDGTPAGSSTPAFSTAGWFLGVGVEMNVLPGWFLRGEYRHAEYGGRSLADTGGKFASDTIRFEPHSDTIEIAAVYRIDGTRP